MNKIKNKHFMITGGASGLGAACADYFADKGANVSMLDHQIVNTERQNQYSLQCDVTNAEQAESTIAAATERFGLINVCINCAGIAPAKRIVNRDGPMPLEEFTKVIHVNLIGTFNIMRLAAASMMQHQESVQTTEKGVIINTASVAAYEGQIGQSAYSASKGAVVSMTLPAAREFAKFGIRVNTIAPGIFATPMMANMPQAVQDSLSKNIPYPSRLGQPEEFAKLAEQMIENEYINGTVVRLDGAIRMQPK